MINYRIVEYLMNLNLKKKVTRFGLKLSELWPFKVKSQFDFGIGKLILKLILRHGVAS